MAVAGADGKDAQAAICWVKTGFGGHALNACGMALSISCSTCRRLARNPLSSAPAKGLLQRAEVRSALLVEESTAFPSRIIVPRSSIAGVVTLRAIQINRAMMMYISNDCFQ